jgi:WD40 repeat protein
VAAPRGPAGPVRGVLTAPSGVVTALAYSPGGGTLAAGYSGGAIRLWDTATQQEIGSPMSSDAKAVAAVAFSPDGTLANRLLRGSGLTTLVASHSSRSALGGSR